MRYTYTKFRRLCDIQKRRSITHKPEFKSQIWFNNLGLVNKPFSFFISLEIIMTISPKYTPGKLVSTNRHITSEFWCTHILKDEKYCNMTFKGKMG